MVIIKLISKRTTMHRFPLTNFLYSTQPIQCSKCHEQINDEYAFLCEDFDKIWHENCLEEDHIKKTFENQGYGVKAHGDKLVYIKTISPDAFETLDVSEISLNC